MGFAKYKISNWLSFHDLPDRGAVGTVESATHDMQKNFRTEKDEMKITLFFKEWKPMTLTNTNLDLLQGCFPRLDVNTIVGARIWLVPVTIEVGGDTKEIVRIDQLGTARMQPDPTATEDDAGQGPTAGESRDEEPPIPGDADAGPF